MVTAIPRSFAEQLKSQGCTNFKLRRLLRRVSQRYDEEMAKVRLKTTQYSLLSNVQRLGPVRPSDLARAMAMDASTLTRNLKPLIAAGWVELGAGSDGRSRLVRLTDTGLGKRAEAKRHWRIAQESMNELLGAERVLALHALIDQTMDLLEPGGGAEEHG
jgi:DNA-binding MarR family transcriptional regulator